MSLFPAKILLFGEYTVLSGSSALSLPCFLFRGSLKFPKKALQSGTCKESNRVLNDLHDYLKEQEAMKALHFDFGRFERELTSGICFASNIPQNYGLGSSGALVAAVMDRYCPDLRRLEPAQLKTFFAGAESFFHGKSSGIDPLTCYVQTPLLIDQQGIHTADAEDLKKGLSTFYLFDTGLPGATGEGVKVFLRKIGQLPEALYTAYRGRVEDAIESVYAGDAGKLESSMKLIAAFQLDFFAEMIPETLHDLWLHGLQSGDYRFKLCGSGGGGYMLIHSHRKQAYLEGILHTTLTPVMNTLIK